MLLKARKYSLLLLVFLIIMSATGLPSCTSDHCAGVVCLNGGACVKHTCSCPSGYDGTRCERFIGSVVTYHNNTFTPIDITINGSSNTIPVGGAVKYSGSIGGPLVGTATTCKMNSAGKPVGLYFTWKFSDVFPEADQTRNLNVNGDYFFLRLINNSAFTITQVYVNYGRSAETFDEINLPNNNAIYDIGYYKAFPTANIHLTAGPHFWSDNFVLGLTENQSYTFTAL